MKHSIDKIFKNLNMLLLAMLTLAIVILLFVTEQYFSYKKIDTLRNQTAVLSTLLKKQKESSGIDIIQYNSQIAQLHLDIEKMHTQQQYRYVSKYISDSLEECSNDLNKLDKLINDYDKLSRRYFSIAAQDKEFQQYYEDVKSAYFSIRYLIDTMMIKNISYDSKRFDISSKMFLLLLIILLFTNLFSRNKLGNIYSDIILLISSQSKKDSADIFSQEADAIALRMKRKTGISENPTMIDSVTEIYNTKGMFESYAEKKSKDGQTTSVTVFEIDNFSKSNRSFSQEFTQEILKKVAYTMSLFEQPSDTIARTDYNRFTVIFSRDSKEQSFKDIELIRQSISEIVMKTEENEEADITVTGGFIIKPKNIPLEETIRKAEELLEHSKIIGKNRIIQVKDIPN